MTVVFYAQKHQEHFMQLYHDSHRAFYRDPMGALPCGGKTVIRIRAIGAERVYLRFYNGSEFLYSMENPEENVFEYTLRMPEVPVLCWYDFRAENNEGDTVFYGSCDDMLGGSGQMTLHPKAWQITVYDPSFDTPHFMRNGIMYQIFPDRFFREKQPESDRDDIVLHREWNELPLLLPDEQNRDNSARDFFGGTLKGIEMKLPYLKDLGITVVYMNPVFTARSNHRYDTGDYSRIDPLLGTNEDLKSLCAAAQRLGMHILLDGVFSHTGDDSLYFNRLGRYPSVGACQSTDSPYYSWYTFEEYPRKYRCWWGFTTLPEINKQDPGYRSFMFGKNGIVRKWIRLGTSGWRLDVADELPMDFLRSLRTAAKKENSDALVLGEVWEDASRKVAYDEMRCYCQGDTLDSVMNYPLREALIDFLTFRSSAFHTARVILSQKENYPAPFYYSLMNLCGSHDRARAVNYLAECTFEDLPYEERGNKRLTKEQYLLGRGRYLMMMRMVCALPGTPCIYYGDEIGMQGAPDPFCRAPYDWEGGDRELKEQIKQLLHERAASPAMRTGDVSCEAWDEDVLVIRRSIRDGKDIFGNAAPDEEREWVFDRRKLPLTEEKTPDEL